MEKLVKIGRLGKTHGLKGDIIFKPEKMFSTFQLKDTFLFIGNTEENSKAFSLTHSRPLGTGFLLQLETITSLNLAQKLTNQWVYLMETDILEAEPDDSLFLPLNFAVADKTPEQIVGKISGVSESKAHPMLEITTPGGKIVLVPWVEDWIISIDKKKKMIVLDLPEGLMDIT